MSEASNSQKPVSLEGLRRNNNNLNNKFSKEFIAKDKIGDGLSVNETGVLSVDSDILNTVKTIQIPINFSIPVSAWTASEDPKFPFVAEISDEAVTADHIAHFDFDKASILEAMTAVVITGDTSEGKITLFAKEAPTVDLSGAYTITRRKGATE